jgi:hypothetical protein
MRYHHRNAGKAQKAMVVFIEMPEVIIANLVNVEAIHARV